MTLVAAGMVTFSVERGVIAEFQFALLLQLLFTEPLKVKSPTNLYSLFPLPSFAKKKRLLFISKYPKGKEGNNPGRISNVFTAWVPSLRQGSF